MVKGYPDHVALRHIGSAKPLVYGTPVRLNKDGSLKIRAFNGNWEGLLRETTLTVLPSRTKVERVELLNLSSLPASESKDYNKALAYVTAHPEDFPIIPGPEARPRHRHETHDDRVYRLFNAAPKSQPYVQDHVLAENLEVPVEDLIAALERHGFASEPVTHEGHAYLKLTRPDGAEFSFDWNGPGSNFYDGYDPMVQPVTRVAELRQLPYAMEGPGWFCAIGWDRAVEPGDVPRRLVSAWPLMESEGPRDLSPAVKEVMAEHAEKKRLSGLGEENKKLKETLERLRAALPRISQHQLLRSTESTPCCGEIPFLDAWDTNDARSVHCLFCGRHTDSYFMRAAALEAWEQLFK